MFDLKTYDKYDLLFFVDLNSFIELPNKALFLVLKASFHSSRVPSSNLLRCLAKCVGNFYVSL